MGIHNVGDNVERIKKPMVARMGIGMTMLRQYGNGSMMREKGLAGDTTGRRGDETRMSSGYISGGMIKSKNGWASASRTVIRWAGSKCSSCATRS